MRPLCVTCWWLGLLTAVGAAADQKDGLEGTEEGSPSEFIYLNRYKRAGESPDKCTYTFIVPQQRVTGAICVNSKEPEVLLENRVHKQELELLNSELLKQKRQIETLQQLVEVDGGIVSEVKLLRKESRNMNSRVTQLYMQLLHEIIRKRDNALELSQLENRILNQTADMLQLASKYKDLEHKYQHLATLARNQSEVIAQLEEHCQRVPEARPAPQPPPAAPPQVYQPSPYNRITNQISTNEIQSDQNLKVLPPPLPTMPTLTSLPSSTDKPSGKSFGSPRGLGLRAGRQAPFGCGQELGKGHGKLEPGQQPCAIPPTIPWAEPLERMGYTRDPVPWMIQGRTRKWGGASEENRVLSGF